jgi:mycothiol synthase
VIGGFDVPNRASAAFAAALGASTGNVERQNRVRVADLDRALLESWNVPAPGYSLVTYDGICPDDLVEEVVALNDVMNDAPRTESLGQWSYTIEKLRGAEASLTGDERTKWYVAARHDATGELAGYTELVVCDHRPWRVDQGDTAVAPAHRGHGLGRWLKAVNALRVLDEWPGAQVIETWNDGTNRWMLAINEAMGFRPVAEWIDAELAL